ncbi:MAG: hypothetical protein AAF243_12300 [Cyanobacteria bacterium P01_A01_bin.137]
MALPPILLSHLRDFGRSAPRCIAAMEDNKRFRSGNFKGDLPE